MLLETIASSLRATPVNARKHHDPNQNLSSCRTARFTLSFVFLTSLKAAHHCYSTDRCMKVHIWAADKVHYRNPML